MTKSFFFDSYALFEIIEGNNNYNPYTENIVIITTKMNLMELYYGLINKFGKQVAEECYEEYAEFTIEINDEVIKRACEFRVLFKSKNLSFIDCLGYMAAKLNNIKFLTGDKQFENLENVEFVK